MASTYKETKMFAKYAPLTKIMNEKIEKAKYKKENSKQKTTKKTTSKNKK